jgi:hypothetical protein
LQPLHFLAELKTYFNQEFEQFLLLVDDQREIGEFSSQCLSQSEDPNTNINIIFQLFVLTSGIEV